MLEKFFCNVKLVNMRNDVVVFYIIVFLLLIERFLVFFVFVLKVLENVGFKVEMVYIYLEKNYVKSLGICNIMNNKNYFLLLCYFVIYV